MSSILSKRIIENIVRKEDHETNPVDDQRTKGDNNELGGHSPPVKRVHTDRSSLSDENPTDFDSQSLLSTLPETVATESPAPESDNSHCNGREKKKIWMKPVGAKKEPRVGSDYQVDL